MLRSVLWRIRGDRASATRIATGAGTLARPRAHRFRCLRGVAIACRDPRRHLVPGGWLVSGFGCRPRLRRRETLLERIDGKDVGRHHAAASRCGPRGHDRRPVDRALPDGPNACAIRSLRSTEGFGVSSASGRSRRAARDRRCVTDDGHRSRPTLWKPATSLQEMLSRPAGMSRRVVVVEAGRVVGIVTGDELAPILSG